MRKIALNRSAVWALDFGSRTVTVLSAREKEFGRWQILGMGHSPAEGRSEGVIAKPSDVCESVTTALREAEKAAGLHCRRLYFNFDDVGALSAHPCGSRTLAGEGQIGREDVGAAARSASRMAADFERVPAYVRDIHYLIDGKDTVGNPVGAFGHRLDVTLLMVLCRAAELEQWKKVMRRVPVDHAAPVLTLVSCVHAVLPRSDERRILWDLGEDVANGGVVEKGILREYTAFLTRGRPDPDWRASVESTSREWMEDPSVSDHVLLTGDRARESGLSLITEVGCPQVVPSLVDPSDCALTGLLKAASRREQRLSTLSAGGEWVRKAREKANTFLQDYF